MIKITRRDTAPFLNIKAARPSRWTRAPQNDQPGGLRGDALGTQPAPVDDSHRSRRPASGISRSSPTVDAADADRERLAVTPHSSSRSRTATFSGLGHAHRVPCRRSAHQGDPEPVAHLRPTAIRARAGAAVTQDLSFAAAPRGTIPIFTYAM